jgi:hypothetical protein
LLRYNPTLGAVLFLSVIWSTVCTAAAQDGSTRTKILKALTAVLPEARVISPNNIYPKLNPATGEFLGSVALEFAKTEKGDSSTEGLDHDLHRLC